VAQGVGPEFKPQYCKKKKKSKNWERKLSSETISSLENSLPYIFFNLILRSRSHTAGAWLPMAYPITSWLLFGSASTSPRTCETWGLGLGEKGWWRNARESRKREALTGTAPQ
jgi:hypothetical protein